MFELITPIRHPYIKAYHESCCLLILDHCIANKSAGSQLSFARYKKKGGVRDNFGVTCQSNNSMCVPQSCFYLIPIC